MPTSSFSFKCLVEIRLESKSLEPLIGLSVSVEPDYHPISV